MSRPIEIATILTIIYSVIICLLVIKHKFYRKLTKVVIWYTFVGVALMTSPDKDLLDMHDPIERVMFDAKTSAWEMGVVPSMGLCIGTAISE